MKLTGTGKNAEPGQKTFSDDILKIELCGPNARTSPLSISQVFSVHRQKE